MHHFSNRRAMSSSGSNEENDRCPGRRPGDGATCRARLKGWLRNVADRSPIWGDVDISAFCRITGYSREHAMRALSSIRREADDLVFETKLRDKKPGGRRTWGVIVADPAKLKFDKCSLFYDAQGIRLHNYTTLGAGGEKMAPTIVINPPSPRPRGRPRRSPVRATGKVAPRADESEVQTPGSSPEFSGVSDAMKSSENTRGCDLPYIGKDSFGIQQPELNGARRDIAKWRGFESRSGERRSGDPLRGKAFSLLSRLKACHWDNCKVHFISRTAFCYAYRSLHDGHEAEHIVSCYADALVVCHGFAVDQACTKGRVTFFAPSSTVSKAAKLLAKDGLSREQRMARWYERKRQAEPVMREEDFDSENLAEMRHQMAASFASAGT